jgi:molybdopterin-guanine dinucleotide biosynthesis protein A
MSHIQGAILAGGKASRFGGRPKGLAEVEGARILDRLVEAFQKALGHLPLLVANDPEAGGWRTDLRVVRDLKPGGGPLGGLYTAVVEGPAPIVCIAWDMPFVPTAFINRLADGLAECDAVVPASRGRRGMEPLCAAYGARCRQPMADALDRGDLRAISFHDSVETCILPLDEVRRIRDPALMFFNVNTEDDLEQAGKLWQLHASSR